MNIFGYALLYILQLSLFPIILIYIGKKRLAKIKEQKSKTNTLSMREKFFQDGLLIDRMFRSGPVYFLLGWWISRICNIAELYFFGVFDKWLGV